jgi:thiamine pyrophosphokinase
MAEPYTLIFANGDFSLSESIRELADHAECLIAADGGLRHLYSLDLLPNILVGDLDSVTPEQIERAEAGGCKIQRFPVEKDQTDLELALLESKKHGYKRIVVVGAFGGRIDQEIANLHLLTIPELNGLHVTFWSSFCDCFLVHSGEKINGGIGDKLSMISLTPEVKGITTEGLKYPLRAETLIFCRSRGISNEVTSLPVTIQFESGKLLCFLMPQERK